MGFWDLGVGYLKTKTEDISETDRHQQALLKTFSFTSVGGGSGSSTLLLYIAQYLSQVEGHQVCVVDLNFLQPDLLYNMDVDVTSENTILNYLKGVKPLEECYIQDANIKKLHLVTASPKDDPVLLMNINTEKNMIGHLIEKLQVFDYILINLPYLQPMITFIEPINYIDRGYLVADERLSASKKIHGILDFIHVFQSKAPVFSNVILNKRTDYLYPYEDIKALHCDIITEISMDNSLINESNTNKPLIEKSISEKIQEQISYIIYNMKDINLSEIEDSEDNKKPKKAKPK